MRRPERVLHFAWDPAVGAAVEPPDAEARAGWATAQRPPAQYFNALFNNYGQWFDFLRAPSLSRWARVALPSTFIPTGRALVLAVDRTTVEGSNVVRRLVAAGRDATGPCVHVSRRGDSWVRRENFFDGPPAAGDFSRVYHEAGGWFLLLDAATAGELYFSTSDLASGTALDGVGAWDKLPVTWVVGLDNGARAHAIGHFRALACRARMYQSFGGAYAAATVTGNAPEGGRGTYTDVVWEPVTSGSGVLIAVSSWGDVVTCASPATTFTSVSRITAETNIDWRLTVGAEGEVIAWKHGDALTVPQRFYRTTDHGATWAEIVSTLAGFELLTDLAYADGAWVATSQSAPYVASSNDLETWVRAALPFVEGAETEAHAVVQSEGAWIVMRADVALVGGRAEDLSPGAWTVDPTPTVLGNAGWLRGKKISLTAPTDGQVLAYVAASGTYVPTTPSGGGGGPIPSTDITDSTAVGRSVLTAANAAAARSALGVGGGSVVTYDFSTSTGFVLQPNAGGASITAGVARLTHAGPNAYRQAGAYDGPAIVRALDAPTPQVDVAARVVAISGGTRTIGGVEIANALTDGRRYLAYIEANTNDFVAFRGDTATELARVVAPLGALTGQEWVRIQAVGGCAVFYYGQGVGGARPAAWTRFHTDAPDLPALWSHVAVALIAAGAAGPCVVDIDDLTILATEVPGL